ncbi:MAG: O-antigen ligase family protein [Bryobacteraceae bacterium]
MALDEKRMTMQPTLGLRRPKPVPPAAPTERQGRTGLGAPTWVLGVLYFALALGAWAESSPLLLWAGLPLALWIAMDNPAGLVTMLGLTVPMFPVLRVATDELGAQSVSTKGLFFSADDPLVLALLVAWARSMLARGGKGPAVFPRALVWLMGLYPAVWAVNALRLDWNQWAVCGLYFLKWAEYALLALAIPGALSTMSAGRLLGQYRRASVFAIAASAVFAAYEMAESIRTGAFSAAASYPRASAFFGTLDPQRFGASEDPVNFGVYAMVAGSIAFGAFGKSRRLDGSSAGAVAAAAVALAASVSRAPWLAAVTAFLKIYRLRSSRLLIGLLGLAILALGAALLLPEVWEVNAERFSAMRFWGESRESSAASRLTIALNSPVFEVDQYWLTGHGHSSYRFIAESHLAAITGRLSRSLYNFFLTIWYDAGPAGLLLWILLFRQLNRKFTWLADAGSSNEVRAMAKGLLGALWGLAAASMFSEVPYNWRVMGVFYTAVGVCLAAEAAGARAARGAVARP